MDCICLCYNILLDRLAESTALTLVFVETKRGASDLAYYLQKDGYDVVAIHGDLKQFEREKHLETFRSGVAPILVATAVCVVISLGYRVLFVSSDVVSSCS